MHRLRLLFQSLVSLIRQMWMLPKSIPAAMKQRRVQTALDVAEAERLDRIRNPSDYRGK